MRATGWKATKISPNRGILSLFWRKFPFFLSQRADYGYKRVNLHTTSGISIWWDNDNETTTICSGQLRWFSELAVVRCDDVRLNLEVSCESQKLSTSRLLILQHESCNPIKGVCNKRWVWQSFPIKNFAVTSKEVEFCCGSRLLCLSICLLGLSVIGF